MAVFGHELVNTSNGGYVYRNSLAISYSFSTYFQANVEPALCAIEDRLPMRDPVINSAFGLQMSAIKVTQ